jgi:sulfonate transport system permease protein
MGVDSEFTGPAEQRRQGRSFPGLSLIGRPVPRWLRRLLGPVVFLVSWHLASLVGLLDSATLTGPLTVVGTAADMTASGELIEHLLVSLRRATIGLVAGVSVGTVLAVLAGLFRLGEDLIDANMQMLRSLPVLGLIPLAILWFGIGEQVKVLLVAVGTAFPVYVNTHAAIRGIDPRYVELAQTVRLSRPALVRRVLLPSASRSMPPADSAT